MELKLLLLVLGLVAQSLQQQGTVCLREQQRTVRLRWSSYAGIVDICWKQPHEDQYRWQPVCNTGWTKVEAGAVCQGLNITTTIPSGVEATLLTGQQSLLGWSLSCPSAAGCNLDTVTITRCFYGNLAIAICDLPPQTAKTPECPSLATLPSSTQESQKNDQELTTSRPQDAAGQQERGPADCAECLTSATPTEGSQQTGCVILVGVLGSAAAIAIALLVGMLLGFFWCYRHHRTIHHIDSPPDTDKMATLTNKAGSQLANPSYSTHYNIVNGPVQRVSPAIPSPTHSHPVMYDTIEDKTPPNRRGTIEREPLYQELEDTRGHGRGTNGQVARLELDQDMQERYEMTSLDNGQVEYPPKQTGEYYEVPVKCNRAETS